MPRSMFGEILGPNRPAPTTAAAGPGISIERHDRAQPTGEGASMPDRGTSQTRPGRGGASPKPSFGPSSGLVTSLAAVPPALGRRVAPARRQSTGSFSERPLAAGQVEIA